jgi:hypothetical protein
MDKITQYLIIIINKQKDIGYAMPDYLRPPAKLSLLEVQKRLDITFNQELNELYAFADGVQYYGLPSGIIGIIPNYIFLSLEEAEKYYNEVIIDEDFFYNADKRNRPQKKLFPIIQSDGNCYWVDLNYGTENYGKIFWTNTDGEYPDYHFESLTSFFKTIAECYVQGIIDVDSKGCLKCDYIRLGKVALENNPSTKYWRDYI